MSVLRKVNLIIPIIVIGVILYHYFIDNTESFVDIITILLAFMYLLSGIEDVKDKDGNNKHGYIYLVVALVLFTGLIWELFKIL